MSEHKAIMVRAAAAVRWLLLILALVLALASLFTAIMAPRWLDWKVRLLIAVISGETGYRFVLVPLIVALAAWALRRRHAAVTTATILFSLTALGLMLKPVAQAWWLGRALPMQLAAAFGPAAPDREPFSLKALFAAVPEPAPVEEMSYHGRLRLDFYRAIGRTPAPCVIFLHGGGWYGGGHRDRRPFTYWMVRQGYAVATIDYRLIPQDGWPAQRTDTLDAIAFLRAHAAAFGIDPMRIVLLGRSAGGQLATVTAYAAKDPGIRGVISFYGPTDLGAMWDSVNTNDKLNGWTGRQLLEIFLGGTPDTASTAYESASSARLVGPASPPTLQIQGGLDSLLPVSQSELLAMKLSAAGRPNLLIMVPWATHGFETVNFDGPGAQISTYAVDWFLAAVTR